MSLTNEAETNLLKLLFENNAWADIGNEAGLQPSAVDGTYSISIHTADPGETGNQTTSECNYTSYTRTSVSRTDGFSVSGSNVANSDIVNFPEATGGDNTATYFGVGTHPTGVGHLLLRGQLNTPTAINNGIVPSFAAGKLNADCT
jgi:hypothetical protein